MLGAASEDRMAQQIRRSSTTGVRRVVRAQSRAVSARKAAGTASGFIDWLMGLLPFNAEQWSRIWLALIIGALAGLGLVIARLAGVPEMVHAEIVRIATDAGFVVRHVRVTGTRRMDEGLIYARVLSQQHRAMPEVDVAALRAELKTLPWVKDARVSIELPHTLAIDIVERTPHAVLEKPDRLVLIDATGVELDTIAPERAKGMLRLAGPGAGRQVGQLTALLAAAPALAPQVERAEWVGNRRWNLIFKTGQLLALPEGDREAASALVKFARLDGQNRLLGGKVLAFDMRSPPRLYLRLPEDPAPAASEAAPAAEGDAL
jgi:cell division protein FtsQ